MRVALAKQLGGIDSVELGDRPDPAPAAGQALIKVHGAGVGPWDVGFLSGGFPALGLPFVPGQEIAGVVEAAGDGAWRPPGRAGVREPVPGGRRVRRTGAGIGRPACPHARPGELPEAAGLVIGAGTAHEGLEDRGRLQAAETVLITAAAGGVGSAAVQIAAAMGARPLGVGQPAQPRLPAQPGRQRGLRLPRRRLGPQAGAAVPGGVDLLLDCTGGHTRDQAIGAVRDGGRVISIVFPGPSPPTSPDGGWRHCAA